MNEIIRQPSSSQPGEIKEKSSSNQIVVVFAVVIGILIIGMVSFIFKKSITKHVPFISSPSITPNVSQPRVAVALESCSLQKEGNPLVDKMTVFKNGLNGTFRGTIISATYTGQKFSSITLLSEDKTEQYTVDIQAENAKSIALTGQPLQIPSNIKIGSLVLIDFRCSPQTKNQFVIIFIGTAAKINK